MERVIEERFISTYICKKAQGRILSGLLCKEKRKGLRAGLSKLMDYINVEFVYLRDASLDMTKTENELKNFTGELRLCYAIAGQYDGEIMPFEKALYESYNDNLASLIIINENLAFIKTEVRNGSSMKYILFKKNKI